MTVMAPVEPGRPFTVDDLEDMPDDGRRYELFDGTLVVSPAPSLNHQRVTFQLSKVLDAARPPGFEVLPGVEYAPGVDRAYQPDIVVVPAGLDGTRLPVAPLLAVEVRSRSTALVDRNLKWAAYARAAIRGYWIVDPREPRLTVFELAGAAYVEVASVAGDEAYDATEPFPVRVVPARLTLLDG